MSHLERITLSRCAMNGRLLSKPLSGFFSAQRLWRVKLVIANVALEMFVVAPLDCLVHIATAEQKPSPTN